MQRGYAIRRTPVFIFAGWQNKRIACAPARAADLISDLHKIPAPNLQPYGLRYTNCPGADQTAAGPGKHI